MVVNNGDGAMRVTFLAIAMLLASSINAETIDFEGISDPVPQTYGDTADVDVSYQVLDGFGSGGVQLANYLNLYPISGYGDLVNVAWSNQLQPTYVGEIRLSGLGDNQINLISFDLAGWAGDQSGRAINIYDENWNSLQQYSGLVIQGEDGEHSSFSPNVTANTVTIQWDYPWGVAIDNIEFSTSLIPEPSTLASLLSLGIVGLVGFWWRRRKAA
jgi:PEP-CTERM motif-containing protein